MSLLDKKTIKLLIDYVIASDNYREKWIDCQSIKDIPRTIRMVEASDATDVIRDQLIDLMGNDDNILNGIRFMQGLISELITDHDDTYS